MKTVRVLFMGASRLVGLLERFHAAAKDLGVRLDLFSFEDNQPWHAIGVAGLARLVPAPPFADPGFQDFFLGFSREESVDIVIPNIDRATIALAKASAALRDAGILPISSSLEVCEAMADKRRADEVFRSLGLRVPLGDRFPLLAKPRFGASSRGIVKLRDADELQFWQQRNQIEEFLFQPFIAGTEFSVDGYVDGRGRTLGIVSRVREVVAEGEVMVARTEHQLEAEAMTAKLLTWGEWRGPFTVQVMHDGQDAWLLECNPRFGSGVTLSIEAGLAVPAWILRECLGLPLPEAPISWRDGLCMTRSRKDHFLWLS